MNLLKIARQKKIPRNKDNRDYYGNNIIQNISKPHKTTSYIDIRNLIEFDIPGKNTF